MAVLRLPNNCIHTVCFWPHTSTCNVSSLFLHQAMCKLHLLVGSRVVCSWSTCGKMCLLKTPPFWAIMTKTKHWLGWRGAFQKVVDLMDALVSSSEFMWPLVQDPRSFVCCTTLISLTQLVSLHLFTLLDSTQVLRPFSLFLQLANLLSGLWPWWLLSSLKVLPLPGSLLSNPTSSPGLLLKSRSSLPIVQNPPPSLPLPLLSLLCVCNHLSCGFQFVCLLLFFR